MVGKSWLAPSLLLLACSVEPPTGDFVTAGSGASGASADDATSGADGETGSNGSVSMGDGSASADASSTASEGSTTASTTDPSTTDPSTTDPSTTDPSTTDPSVGESTGPAPFCGDGAVDPGEDCDSGLGGETCVDQGFDGGTLVCANDCTWDTAGCDLCGDGVVSGAEACDGDEVGGTTCTDLQAPQNGNFTGGTLMCLADCSGYDDGGCTWCGDGSLNGSEICEGNQLGGATCVDAGWLPGGGGNVACTGACALDDASCTGTMCGGSLAVPPDGAGVCDVGWNDSGTACTRNCGNCGNAITCPADRNCELTCGVAACDSATIDCADGHACEIDCTSTSACQNSTITCPQDGPCNVTCSGTSACSGLAIVCPTGNHACTVSCSGTSGCQNLDVTCGDGPCDITCANSSSVCNSADVVCGENSCTGSCAGTSKATLACGASCDCVPC